MGYLTKRKAEKRQKKLVACLVVILASFSFANIFPLESWKCDFLAQFRLQYVIAAVILTLFCLTAHRWKSSVCAIIILIINLSLMMAHINFSNTDFKPQEVPLKILIFNTKIENQNNDAVLKTIRNSGADYAFLMEVSKDRLKSFNNLRPPYRFKHEYIHSGSQEYSSVILSRKSFRETGVIKVKNLPSGLWVKIRHNQKNIVFIGTHLKPFSSDKGYKDAEKQINAFTDFIRNQNDSVVVMGGFNAAPWTPLLYTFERKGGLKAKGGLLPSWNSKLPWIFRIPQDYVYTHQGIDVFESRFLDDSGSNHMPVLMTIGY